MILETDDKISYSGVDMFGDIPLSQSDIYIITAEGDRLDSIALEYYKNPSYWKVIVLANINLDGKSLYVKGGLQLRIPFDMQSISEIVKSI